jgi:hypothetical protein
MVLVLATFICFVLPLYIIFDPPFGHTFGWHFIEYFIEAIFCIDVLVHFNTTLYDHDGNEVFDRKHIAHHYLSEYHFWIDMAATIPLGVIILPNLSLYRIIL